MKLKIHIDAFLWSLLIFLQGCKSAFCFLDIEELKELKYGIEITKKPVLFSKVQEENVLHLSSKYGQMYQCNIPMRNPAASKSEDATNSDSNVTVKSILDADLEGQCLFYTLGWWTYKVCYMKEVTQYHEEHGLIQGNVLSLGTFDSEKEWNETNHKEKSKGNEHHYQKYVNGSNCELVGKQRETTVKFFCNEEVTNSIIAVDEPETCVYTITVNSKALCMHPLFKPTPKKIPKEIMCSPALTQDQFEKYVRKEKETMQKKQERERLKASEGKTDKNSFKVDVLSNALNSFVTGFTSFIKKPLESPEEKSKNSVPVDDLSNFWKDLGIDPAAFGDKPEKGRENVKDEKTTETTISGTTISTKSSLNGAESDEGIGPPPKEPISGTDEVESAEILEDTNVMSKGEGMLSSEGKLLERKSKNEEKVSKMKESIKRLLSLQETINEIDQQAAELIKKDQEKRDIFVKHFAKSKKKAEKQFDDFRTLLNHLVKKKENEKDEKKVKKLEYMIKRIEDNMKTYGERLGHLDRKMENSLKRSEAFERRYKDIQDMFKNSKVFKKETKLPEKEPITSLNDILKGLRLEKSDEEADGIAKTGDEIELNGAEDAGKDTEKPMSKKKETQVDPMLDAVIKMLKLGSRVESRAKELGETGKEKDTSEKDAGETDTGEKDVDDSNVKTSVSTAEHGAEHTETDSSSATKSSTEDAENMEDVEGKVKVKISRLGNDEVKLLEENEKQEELSGTNNANNKLKKAGKKIENMIKEKLKKAGVDLGANIKIKIITNDGPLSSLASNSKTDFLTDETATQFKDMLVNMLGGGTEKVKEEKRQSNLEDSYKFLWNEDEQEIDDERSEDKDDKIPFL